MRVRIVLSLAGLIAAGTAFAEPPIAQPSSDALRMETERQASKALDRYREFLRLPNDAQEPDDLEPVLGWLTAEFSRRGFATSELATGRIPLLLAERETPGATKTLLVYLQADGQPVDPAAWDQESPWEPVLKEPEDDGSWRALPWPSLAGARQPDWRIFARSAADSKGPIVQFLTALDVLAAVGGGPSAHLKVIIDAEEELGSPRLAATVERERERLAANELVIFDGPPHPSGEPTLVFGARGIATVTLTAYGPRTPQHSGHYGNYVPNPAFRLARLLASLKDAEGRVTLPGFYDGVELTAADRAALTAVPDDPKTLHRKLGIGTPERVADTLQESIQYPSLNVRGLQAGWVGEQARTIIPATATAEIDVRLVVESDAVALLRSLRQHIEKQGFRVIDAEPTEEERLAHRPPLRWRSQISYGAFRTPLDSELGHRLQRALTGYHGREPIRLRTLGGSIPIAPFVTTLGVPAVAVPTVNPDNHQHSPNENLRLGDFLDGVGVIAAVLCEPWE